MGEVVTLNLPEDVAKRARQVASETHRRMEDVLVEWLDHTKNDIPIGTLSDAEILTLCDSQLSEKEQTELDELLFDQQEGQLTDRTREQLETLMGLYRRGMVRKAQALQVAVARGLRAPLS